MANNNSELWGKRIREHRSHWVALVLLMFGIVVSVAVIVGNHHPPNTLEFSQTSNASICLSAYEDRNGDEVREADEPLIANIQFKVSDSNQNSAAYITDGRNEPYCFRSLVDGVYTIQTPGLSNLKSTAPHQWVVQISKGTLFEIRYGGQWR